MIASGRAASSTASPQVPVTNRNAARTASSSPRSGIAAIRCASTSESVSERKATPVLSSRARSAAAFSMMPLWMTAMRFVPSQCGWAFLSLGSPCVAQRVWAIPGAPLNRDGSSLSSSRTRPLHLAKRSSPAWATAIPAES
jgi:hypothetical protein